MRMLAGVLAGQAFASKITGDDSLRKRPMRRVMEPLRQMGAEIRSQDGDRAPLEIRGGELHAIDYTPPTPSAQVKSAVLLAGLYAEGMTTHENTDPNAGSHRSWRCANLARRLETAGAGNGNLSGGQVDGRATGGAGRPFCGGLSDRRTAGAARIVADVAQHGPESHSRPGARLFNFHGSVGPRGHLCRCGNGELVGDVSVRHAPLAGGTISGSQVAEMIDELPMLAALGPYTEKGIEIHDAQGTAREGERPHRGARRGVAPNGRARGRVSGRLASGGTVCRKVARRQRWIRAAIIASRWRWRWRRWARRAKPRFAMPSASGFLFRSFLTRSTNCGVQKESERTNHRATAKAGLAFALFRGPEGPRFHQSTGHQEDLCSEIVP